MLINKSFKVGAKPWAYGRLYRKLMNTAKMCACTVHLHNPAKVTFWPERKDET